MKKIVSIILDKFADWEGAYMGVAFSELGIEHEIKYASLDKLPKVSIGGLTVLPDMTVDEIPRDTDILILLGANASWRKIKTDAIKETVVEFIDRGKVVGAICDAATYLGLSGVLNNYDHTLNSLAEMKDFEAYTGNERYQKEESVRDNNLVTANGNAPVEFTANVLRAVGIEEEDVMMFYDFYRNGYHKALKKYGFE